LRCAFSTLDDELTQSSTKSLITTLRNNKCQRTVNVLSNRQDDRLCPRIKEAGSSQASPPKMRGTKSGLDKKRRRTAIYIQIVKTSRSVLDGRYVIIMDRHGWIFAAAVNDLAFLSPVLQDCKKGRSVGNLPGR